MPTNMRVGLFHAWCGLFGLVCVSCLIGDIHRISIPIAQAQATGSPGPGAIPIGIPWVWQKEFDQISREEHRELIRDVPNIVLTKTKKVGGSTLGGILRRYAKHHGIHGYSTNHSPKVIKREVPEPKILAAHAEGLKLHEFEIQLVGPVAQVTAVRAPVSRCVSHYYYMHGTRFHDPVSEQGLVKFCSGGGTVGWNYQTHYARRNAHLSVQQVFAHFDLVVVAERFNEGIMALAQLLHGQLLDFVYVKAKVAAVEGVKHPKANELVGVAKQFFQSKKWLENSADDYELYRLANKKMDELTSSFAGTPIAVNETHNLPHEEATELYVTWLRALDKECGIHGELTKEILADCYWADNGCAFRCMNDWLRKNGFTQRTFEYGSTINVMP